MKFTNWIKQIHVILVLFREENVNSGDLGVKFNTMELNVKKHNAHFLIAIMTKIY